MKNQKIQLKVKVKSLAEEARIIRKEERKAKGRDSQLLSSLQCHRRISLREESRSAQLAYAFLRGLQYEQVERKCKTPPNWYRVKQLVEKFGRCWNTEENYSRMKDDKKEELVRFEKWKNAAFLVGK